MLDQLQKQNEDGLHLFLQTLPAVRNDLEEIHYYLDVHLRVLFGKQHYVAEKPGLSLRVSN